MNKNRLKWAARRGLLELDLLLGDFLERHYDALTHSEQQLFQELLKQQDPDLLAWFVHRQKPPTAPLQKIVALIRRKLAD
ncbi:MAG: succinate dehydrogenase assembly factor 2 [Cellvibrionales bacterium]|nr:succinate dehydrogenase assembly factor 2 [Cellvibrionales bacterium]